jgi:preprotein translocase subunit SecG
MRKPSVASLATGAGAALAGAFDFASAGTAARARRAAAVIKIFFMVGLFFLRVGTSEC